MITFRGMCITDLEFFNEVRNSCAEKYLHDSRKFTLEQTKEWFKITPNIYYIIENDGEKIGYFRMSNYSEQNKNIYIGADLHENYRGKGFGYEAYKMFINFLFKTIDLNKISLEVLETNGIAMKLYKKLGFIEEGRKRDDVRKSGMYYDSVIMSILRRGWNKKFVT
jgi:RimJ/RimL family protein N-acetyltransferase